MIGGLQGDFGDLDNKYLKQNISKYPKMSVANIRELQENTATLVQNGSSPIRVDAIRWSGYVRQDKLIRLLSHPASEFRMWTSGWKVHDSRVWMAAAGV